MACRAGKFSLPEQLWMQLSFHGLWILGATAMSSAGLLYALGYVVLFPLVGIVFCVMRLWVCPRCPHLHAHASCVQAPASVARWLVGERVSAPLTAAERAGFYVALYGVALVPLAWVVQDKTLLVPYLLLTLMHYSGYHLRLCKRCLNVHCPQSSARRTRPGAGPRVRSSPAGASPGASPAAAPRPVRSR